jgi:serine/threonine protein kinase
MQIRDLSMRSNEDTDPRGLAGHSPEQRTPDIDGDTLLRDVDTPHLRNEVHRRLFGKVVDPVRIARFPVLRRIGHGGMGVVFAAFDNELDRKVAIKLLRPGLGDDGAQLRDRLLREAKALARLSHPAIVQVYEAGEHDGQVYLAMEFVEGRTLRQWCDAERRSVRELLDKFLQAGEGLVAAHAAGLVHRDFKPDNVIVGDDGRVRVLDFGLALLGTDAAVVLDEAVVDLSLDRLTRTGAMIGTPAYMAPEQLLGEPADARSDQFSFAVTLYEAIFGVRPFVGETLEQLRAAVVKGDIAAAKAGRDAAPVARALRRALLPDREQRYADLAELLAALRKTQRRRGVVFAAVGVIVAMGVGGVLEQRSRAAEIESLAATVDSLGNEVQGERSRADDAETQLRKRGDVLTLGEARFSAKRDPSLALSLLSRLSDDDEAWGADTWSLVQRSAAGATAEEIVPVPPGQVAHSVVLDGRAVILVDQRTEGSTLWFPWEERSLVLAEGRHSRKRVDERTWIIQNDGSNDAVVWDFAAGAAIAPLADVELGWSIVSEDRTKLVKHLEKSWAAVDLRTLAQTELPITRDHMLVFVGGSADWTMSFGFERLDATGKVTAKLHTEENENSMYASLGDGRFARLVGHRLQIWNSVDNDVRTLDLGGGDAPVGMYVSEDGKRLAVGDVAGRLLIVDTRTLAAEELHPTTGRIDPRKWLADGRLLFARTADGGVLVDVERGGTVALLQGREIKDVRLDDEQRLVSISDGVIRRWSIDLEGRGDPEGRDLVAIDGPAADGTYVALRDGGELVRWSGAEWKVVGRHEGAMSLSVAAKGDVVVTTGSSGLMWWSLASDESRRLRDRLDDVALIEPPAVDPNGRWAVVHAEQFCEVIDLRDGTSRKIGGPGLMMNLAFAADEARFYMSAMRGGDDILRRWETETWQELPEVPLAGEFLAIAAGRRIAVRGREDVTIVELDPDGAPSIVVPLGFVTALRFSSDGRMLAGMSRDGRVVLGDSGTGRAGQVGPRLRARARMMSEHDSPGSGAFADKRRVAFSSDGTRVLVLDSNGALQRSHLLPPAQPSELRAWVRTNAPRLPASATLEDLAPDDESE